MCKPEAQTDKKKFIHKNIDIYKQARRMILQQGCMLKKLNKLNAWTF